MEELQKWIPKISKEAKIGSSNSSPLSESPFLSGTRGGGGGGGGGVSAALSSSNQSHVLVTRAPRQLVSLWTCSKLCAISFAVGVVFGFTLKRRVKRWASKLLKRLKDN
uniref:Transmembrane protein n=1 Tax=Fagus sylvatica TaxID=28930 RepID=A0A2N9H507_FAGSY